MDGATVGMLSGHALSPLFVGVLDGLGNDFLFVGCSGTPISLLRCGFLVWFTVGELVCWLCALLGLIVGVIFCRVTGSERLIARCIPLSLVVSWRTLCDLKSWPDEAVVRSIGVGVGLSSVSSRSSLPPVARCPFWAAVDGVSDRLWVDSVNSTATCPKAKLVWSKIDGMVPDTVVGLALRLSQSFDDWNKPEVCGKACVIPL